MAKKLDYPPGLWDELAERFYRKNGTCGGCGGWFIKSAYYEGYKAGLAQAHRELATELKADKTYPFDDLQAWIDGETNDDN